MHEILLLQKTWRNAGALLAALGLSSTMSGGCTASTFGETSPAAESYPHLPQEMLASLGVKEQDNPTPLTAKERVRVLELLSASGHDVKNAVFFAEGAVLIENDLLFYGPTVLKNALVERKKGRWFGPGGDPAFGYNVLGGGNTVRIVWRTPPPDWGWGFAFWEAQMDWAQNTNVKFTFDANADATVEVVPFSYPSVGWVALTAPGHDIYDPSVIGLNTNYNGIPAYPNDPNHPCRVPTTSQLPYDVKRRVARHELAHAIGFAHSDDTGATQIGETSQGSYPTVMESGCTNTPTTLTADDIQMINIVYYLPPL